jgi:tetratricopeptide (TPR) repeat protein
LREILKKTRDRCINASDWLNYGNQLWRFEQNEEAINAFEKAIALQSDFYQAYYGKGSALRDEGKKLEALAAFKKATQLAPNFTPAWRWQGNILFFELKKYDRALAAYDKAIELDPKDFVLHIERGDVLRQLKHFPQAVASYNELQPSSSTQSQLGTSLLQPRASLR